MNNNKNRSGSFLWPLILITVGAAFLLQNLGLLGGNLWDTIFRLWPVLVILLGVNDLIRNRGIVGPTFTIGIGTIFLANNLRLLNWDSWVALLRLWPVLIIAIGLEIFIGRKNIWLSAVGVGFTLSLLLAGLWFAGGVDSVNGITSPRLGAEVLTEEIEQPLGSAESAEVRIDSSVGSLTIGTLSNNDNLIEGSIYSVDQEIIYQEYEIDGDVIEYYLGSEWEPSRVTSFSGFDDERLSWDLSLTDEIPLDLSISLGVGESELDLSELQVTDLDLSIGVGQTEIKLPVGEYNANIDGGVGQSIITLPEEGQIEIHVDGGVGEMVIYTVEDMAIKIYIDRGIAGLSVPSGYHQNEDIYTSPNYDEGDHYIELHLSQGIGNIDIREK
jgi:hypothetical protein